MIKKFFLSFRRPIFKRTSPLFICIVILLLLCILNDAHAASKDFRMQVQLGNTGLEISQVAFTSDGQRLIATGGVWDVRNGRRINDLGLGGPFVVSPDSQRIAAIATSRDKATLVIAPLSNLDAAKRVPLGEYDQLSNKKLSVVAFHPTNPNFIIIAYYDHLAVFDLTQQKIIKEFSSHKHEIKYGATQDGSRAVSGSVLDEIRVWDVAKGSCLAVIKPPLVPSNPSQSRFCEIDELVLSDDGSLLAGRVFDDQYIHIWTVPEGKEVVVIRRANNSRNGPIAFSPDNKYLADGEGSEVVIHDLVRGTKLMSTNVSENVKTTLSVDVRAIRFSRDNTTLAYGCWSLDSAQNDRMLGIIDVKTGKIIQVFNGIDWEVNDIDVAEKAKKLAFASGSYRPIWNLNSLSLDDALFFRPEKNGSFSGPFSLAEDASKALIGRYVWELNPPKVLFKEELKFKEKNILEDARARFPDNNNILLFKWGSFKDNNGNYSGIYRVELKDLTSKNVQWGIEGSGYIHPIAFSSDNRKVVVNTDIWKVGSDKPVAKLDIQGEGGLLLAISMVANDTLVAVLDTDSRHDSHFLGVYSASNGSELKRVRLPSDTWYNTAAFASDGSRAWIADKYGSIQEWDLHSMKKVKELRFTANTVKKMVFLPDMDCIALQSESPVITLYQIKTGHLLHLLSSGDDWIAYTEDGYFDCSLGGAAYVNIISGNSAYGAEQFALRLNRPDIILERFNLGTKDQIQYFRRQYQKRLSKLGIPEGRGDFILHVPEVKINQASRKGAQARLVFSMRDDLYPIRSYQIYVNGVPLFGGEGKNAEGKTEVEEEFLLSHGLNRVEVSCMNKAGAESFREMTQLTLEEPVLRRLFYVGIGVSKYKDPSLDLSYADKDAQDLADTFARMGNPFEEVKVKVFSNDKATREVFREASDWLGAAGVHDTVVVFLAGHGVHDRDPDATYYFLTHEAKLTNLSATSANFDMIENLMAGVAARQKLLLLDTCESGELEENVTSNYLAQAASRGIRSRSIRKDVKDNRGLSVVSGTQTKSPRSYLLKRDRLILMDMTRRTGSIIFSASRGDEFSYESDELKNGYFTAGLLRSLIKNDSGGIARPVTTADIREQVRDWVVEQTGGLQHPTVDRDNVYQLFAFPSAQVQESVMPSAVDGASFADDLGMKFVYIQPGTFIMGSPSNEWGRDSFAHETQHQVTLTRGFYMQTTEVTQGQWRGVMGSNPSEFSSCGDACPVGNVSWDDVQEFIRRLNQKTGNTYRLPTEAEWEYACRAGSSGRFCYGDRETGFGNYAQFQGNSRRTIHPVAQKQANAWGLYDMHGNVSEWCADFYEEYKSDSVINPIGVSPDTEESRSLSWGGSGYNHVERGGCWIDLPDKCRSAARSLDASDKRSANRGFRLVRTK